ncbi:MAG: hypothetical protein PsegKO_34660 [Pseudohongiellaceae bacterium]
MNTNSCDAQTEGFSVDGFGLAAGLPLWKKWLGSMIAVVCLVSLGYQFSHISFYGVTFLDVTVYGTLFVLAFVAISASYRSAKFIDRESSLASQQLADLATASNIDDFLLAAETSEFKNHIQSLVSIFHVSPEVSQDNLVEILQSRLMAGNRVVELFSSTLITLGLIGTIIGLIIMTNSLGEIMATTGSADTSSLMSAIAGQGGPLSGLGVAFYTTLLGAVLGGVVLRILSGVIEASIMQYTAQLAGMTEVHVLPRLRQMGKALEKAGYYDTQQTVPHGDP